MSLFTIFSGRPTTNPEMKQSRAGTEYISLDIAVPQYSPDGEENAIFVQCYFNKALADRLLKAKVVKGSCLQIRGDLKANISARRKSRPAGSEFELLRRKLGIQPFESAGFRAKLKSRAK